MIAMALWIISSKNVKTRASKSPSSAIIKKPAARGLGLTSIPAARSLLILTLGY